MGDSAFFRARQNCPLRASTTRPTSLMRLSSSSSGFSKSSVVRLGARSVVGPNRERSASSQGPPRAALGSSGAEGGLRPNAEARLREARLDAPARSARLDSMVGVLLGLG